MCQTFLWWVLSVSPMFLSHLYTRAGKMKYMLFSNIKHELILIVLDKYINTNTWHIMWPYVVTRGWALNNYYNGEGGQTRYSTIHSLGGREDTLDTGQYTHLLIYWIY